MDILIAITRDTFEYISVRINCFLVEQSNRMVADPITCQRHQDLTLYRMLYNSSFRVSLSEKCGYSEFSRSVFPVFGLNTEIYFVNLCILSKCGKMQTRKFLDRTLLKQCFGWCLFWFLVCFTKKLVAKGTTCQRHIHLRRKRIYKIIYWKLLIPIYWCLV